MPLFSGVNTGRFYEVGKRYTTGAGETYVANDDGSFTNERTNRRSVGSSQSSKAVWLSNVSIGGGRASGSPRVTNAKNRTSENRAGVNAGVSTPAKSESQTPIGPALAFGGAWRNEGARPFEGTAPLSYELDEYGYVVNEGPDKVAGRKSPFGWFDWEANPHWPSAQIIEDEYGEDLGPGTVMLWGKFFAGDVPWNLQRAFKHQSKLGRDWAVSAGNPRVGKDGVVWRTGGGF